MSFRAIVEQTRADYMVSKSALNEAVRVSLVDGPAATFTAEVLSRKFEPSAFARYGYPPRSGKWNEIKRRGSERLGVPPMSPPIALVWTGAAGHPLSVRETVLGGVASGETLRRAQGIARGERMELRVKIPIPHPLNPRNAGELKSITADEKRRLDQRARAELRVQLAKAPKVRIRTTL